MPRYTDRRHAGSVLAEHLGAFAGEDPVVVALPRGGVPVAYEVARALDAPLDVLVVRKLGAPSQPELGVGAIGEGGILVRNEPLIRRAGIDDQTLIRVEERERAELDRRVAEYRGGAPMLPVAGRTVILVDDGLATGFTIRAGAAVLREMGADRVVLAVPVGAPDTVDRLTEEGYEVVCPLTPRVFWAIGEFYDDFTQTTDEEVIDLLAAASQPGPDPASDPVTEEEVTIPVDSVVLPGILSVPSDPIGIVVFAHGSGSSRLSPRNAAVARHLNGAGMATLLFDLLTDAEARDRGNVFDVPLLGGRLEAVTQWVAHTPATAGLPVGYFGASTGAAAALWAAADTNPAAVVSRGGRPDLALRLEEVTAPTLLLVGSRDEVVIGLNRNALARLTCPADLVIVPGAGHLFEEPGTLEYVAKHAADWFAAAFGEV
jgi:putative phosphoribosyl transferase